MVETLFVQLGDLMVNISAVDFIKPAAVPNVCFIYFHQREQPVELRLSFSEVQRCLAETYQQMAMMQAAANRGGYSPMGGVQ